MLLLPNNALKRGREIESEKCLTKEGAAAAAARNVFWTLRFSSDQGVVDRRRRLRFAAAADN